MYWSRGVAHEASWPPKKLLKKIPEKPNAGGMLGSVAAALICGSELGVGTAALVVRAVVTILVGTIAGVGTVASDGEPIVIGLGTGARAIDTNGPGSEEEAGMVGKADADV
jgi:Na+/citrate or Na+/malate symporter